MFQVYQMGSVSFSDTGWYSCRVVNEHMDDESCGYLEVVAEEPKASEVLIGVGTRGRGYLFNIPMVIDSS